MHTLTDHRRIAALLLMLILVSFASACSDDETTTPPPPAATNIAVMSDLHYYDRSLGVGGAAWDAYLFSDPKLIEMSKEIIDAIVADLKTQNVKYVLVPGDLTKDGEKLNHEQVAAVFKGLEDAGMQVFVVPGNHDVSNPAACGFNGDNTVPQPSVTPSEFATIYANYGYAEAIARDASSLSYAVNLGDKYRLIAIDAADYESGSNPPPTVCRIKPETKTWVETQISTGKADGRIVLGLLHPALVEHFTGQSQFPITSEYPVTDWTALAANFSARGMRAVFTGHFHANDIVKYGSGTTTLYDIATGSAVSAPCPYRIMTPDGDGLKIASRKVESINYNTNGVPFPTYATNFLRTGLTSYITSLLLSGFGLSEQQAGMIAPAIADAYVANYAGDEVITPAAQGMIALLNSLGDPNASLIASLIGSMYNDPLPADNTLNINLVTGATY
jgi:predicted phosphodiesterase